MIFYKGAKFGSVKYVFPNDLMKAMRAHLTGRIAVHLPTARILYWT